MLAMQLAAEDDDAVEVDPDPDAHLNELISNYEKSSHQQVQRHTPMEQEDVSIPASPPPSYHEFAVAAGKSVNIYLDIVSMVWAAYLIYF